MSHPARPRPVRSRALRLSAASVAGALTLALVAGCSSSTGGAATLPQAAGQTVAPSTASPGTASPGTVAPGTASTAASGPGALAGAATGSAATQASGGATGSTVTNPSQPIDLTTGQTPTATVAPPGSGLGGNTDAPTANQSAPPATDVTVVGDKGTATDQLVKNALSDIFGYWASVSQATFGTPLPPLKGKIYAVDPDDPKSAIPACLSDPADARNNAFYCPADDSISYDAVYLDRISKDYSPLDVAFTFAHEFGHALQNRFVTAKHRSIVVETQADCFAGVWAKSVFDGKNPHWSFSADQLDRVLGDYTWEMGDPQGFDPNNRQAHGSVFDRISATQEGYQDGAASCLSNFNDSRIFTAEKFTTANGGNTGGNADLQTTVTQTGKLLDKFWGSRFAGGFTPPTLNQDKHGNGCSDSHLVSVCTASGTIDMVPMTDINRVYIVYGDYGVASAMILAYTRYLQQKYGTNEDVSTRMCALGATTAEFSKDGVLSPGDFDEAIRTIVFANKGNRLVDTGTGTAWDRLDDFRVGVFQGLGACKLS
jgi:predicted metalloprotease